jgi:hypothetical protein
VLTDFGEILLIWIPSALAVLVSVFFVLRWLARRGAKVQLEKLRRLHPALFDKFRMTVEAQTYETPHRVDYVKLTSHFRIFLECHGISNPWNPVSGSDSPSR